MGDPTWRRCSICKSPIEFGATHWVCNVSTCNRKRTGLIFCDVSCWDAHLSSVNHRESWAVERQAPSRAQWQAEQAEASRSTGASKAREPRRIVARPAAAASPRSDEAPREILIIASRLKAYIEARSGMRTSDGVLDPLSDIVRSVCDEAIENARRAERKTVLDRDVPDRARR